MFCRGSDYQEEWRKWPVTESLLFGIRVLTDIVSFDDQGNSGGKVIIIPMYLHRNYA